ncbi:MAG: hypothetical protein LBT74_13820 [Acidobacteriota bacterium]|jgi:hypothetical protein|nr:hypothetical protein [Acidobacteriota bacterium]
MAQTAKTNAKTKEQSKDLLAALGEVRAQLAVLAEAQAQLAERVAQLEGKVPSAAAPASVTPPPEAPKPALPVAPAAPAAPAKQEIGEEELLVISAALGAYLGVRVHIRQVRLLSSSAWAQQGRVSGMAHIPYTHTTN